MNRSIILTLALTFLFSIGSMAQSVPSPGPEQERKIIIMNATAHIGDGNVIPNSAIGIENGKITFIVDATTARIDISGADVIKAEGKHVYPGLIALNTRLGLTEIDAVRATRDFAEVGQMNPNIRSIVAYNTDSRVIPTIRSNGIMLAQIAPVSGRISGTSCVVNLDAWNWEDAVIDDGDGILLNWPSIYKMKGWWGDPQGYEKNKDYDKAVQQVKDFFNEARAYHETKPEKKNLKFEAMKDLLEKKSNLYVRVNSAKEIMAVINFTEMQNVKPVIVGGEDAWMLANILAKKNIPVILGPTHSLPAYPEQDVDQPFKNPSILKQAGVLFAISRGDSWDNRNLPFHAGTAAAHGLEKEDALKAITLNAAKILGIDTDYGSLENKKSATLIISEGDVLDMSTSKVTHAFIDGRRVNLTDKQKQLYQKFSEKYGIEVVN